MRNRVLPPLNSLRAFEAAARLGSVTAAANEMNVSPSAISQQVRILENWAGVQFIARTGVGFSVTDRGMLYLERLTEAFDIVSEATDRALGRTGATGLRLTVLPSLAMHWLIPRLQSFSERHPDIDIEIDSTPTVVNFDRDDVEVGIRYGLGNYPDAVSELLLPDAVAPVFHPDLLEPGHNRPALTEPKDLDTVRLLHENGALMGRKIGWREWLGAAEVTRVECERGLVFSDSHLTIQAALSAEGVMLGRRVLVHDLIAQGKLVAPFGPWLRDQPSYFLVHSRLRTPRPAAKAFMRWVKDQARMTREADPVLAL